MIEDDLDLGSDNLQNLGVEQTGGIGHVRLWTWLHEIELTLEQVAAELGISRRMLIYSGDGEKLIPRSIWLACLGWDAGMLRWIYPCIFFQSSSTQNFSLVYNISVWRIVIAGLAMVIRPMALTLLKALSLVMVKRYLSQSLSVLLTRLLHDIFTKAHQTQELQKKEVTQCHRIC